ncbi:hypothetical protein Pfo_029022 [Paulownia fortunei]|nr:hypothetical protein Pfo_029022 [Paulownia fortunei]
MQYFETIFSDEYMEFPVHVDELHGNSPIDDFQMDFDEFDCIFYGDANDMPKSLDETEERGESHRSQQLPSDGFHEWNPDHAVRVSMEVDNQLCLVHLLMAYAEAMNNQETELSEVIAQRIIQKVNPVGGTMERVLHYMFQHLNKQSDYLTQESTKNFYPAFKAFYQMFPYGKFAHFVANLSFRWRFEETKRRLCDHAGSYGLKMKVEEVGLQDLKSVMNNIKKGDYGRKSWYVFNCNVGLPHMGRVRSRKDVLEFLRVAKNFLHHATCWDTSKGIITYADGDAVHNSTGSILSYSSFLDGNFAHYQALLESMEFNFPNHLGEARTALECLFVAPYVSSVTWDWKWEETRQCGDLEFGLGLEGWELSEASLAEAKELVKERLVYMG